MQNRFYEFGKFHIDVAARQLYCEGAPVSTLPSRLFDCVVHLIEHRGRAVGRDELIAVVWEREDRGDNLLGQLIVRARRLFNDTGDEQRVIRTVPSFGYQWVAPTRVIESNESTSAPPESTPAPSRGGIEPAMQPTRYEPIPREPAPRASLRWHRWMIVAALALAATIGTWLASRSIQPAAKPDDPAHTEAVAALPPPARNAALILPAIVAAGSDQDWLRMGIMALISERLEKAGQPTVPSDNVAALTRGLDIASLDIADYAALADAAAAGWIVQTRVGPVGAHWRVTLTVVHGKAPKPLRFSVDADAPVDAAHILADEVIAALDLGGTSAAASREAEALAFVLKKAEASFLDQDPEAAAALLADARLRHPNSTELDYQLAWMQFKSGRFAEAEAGLHDLLARLSSGKDAAATARAMNGLANIALARDDRAGLEDWSRRAVDLLQVRRPDSVELGRAWLGRAIAASIAGHYDTAFADFSRARTRLAAANNWLGVAHADAGAGIALRQQGNIEAAGSRLELAAERLGLFSEVDDETIVRTHLVHTELDRVNPIAALAQDSRLTELANRTRWEHVRTLADLTRAETYFANGRLADAQPLLDRAYAAAIAAPQLPNRYQAHSIAARRAVADDDTERARREATLAIATECDGATCAAGDDRDLAYLHLLLVRLQAHTDLAAAKDVRTQLVRRMASRTSGHVDVYVRLADAEIAISTENFAGAKSAFESALSNSGPGSIDLLRVASAYVPWLIARGDADRAEAVVAKLGDLRGRDFRAAVLELRVRHARGSPAAWRSALDRAMSLAGERGIPATLRSAPTTAAGFID
jgi:DNA-binding winged helix-turn-helix (wHTH) protein/tetratricopeptide (TPR) repeat protein